MPEGVYRLVTLGAPVAGILTVSGVPARCMHRSERLVGLLATRRPEPTMTVARSVAGVLDDHVVFAVESIDRIYLNVWQPGWPTAVGWRALRRPPRLSPRLHGVEGPDDQGVPRRHHGFVAACGLELISLARGRRKDDIAHEFLTRFTDQEGVLCVGRAQEKVGLWRTQGRPKA